MRPARGRFQLLLDAARKEHARLPRRPRQPWLTNEKDMAERKMIALSAIFLLIVLSALFFSLPVPCSTCGK